MSEIVNDSSDVTEADPIPQYASAYYAPACVEDTNDESADIEALKQELIGLDHTVYPIAAIQLQTAINKLESGTVDEPEYLELDVNQAVRVRKRILVPVHRYPHFNFVGKILGPGGSIAQSLITKNKCRLFVLGRGSSKGKEKETELLASDPENAHLLQELHIQIETLAPPPMAYARIAQMSKDLTELLQPIPDWSFSGIPAKEVSDQSNSPMIMSDAQIARGRGTFGLRRSFPSKARGSHVRGGFSQNATENFDFETDPVVASSVTGSSKTAAIIGGKAPSAFKMESAREAPY